MTATACSTASSHTANTAATGSGSGSGRGPRPPRLLLDEPLDSLDLPNQGAVATLIGRICHQEGVSVVMVAHDVNPILHHLDRVVYLAEGGAATGTPAEVITSETLTRLYGTPVEVLRTSGGRLVVVGQPEPPSVHTDRHGTPRGAALTLAATAAPVWFWNLITDIQEMWSYPFMVNAVRAGAVVAVVSAVVGWFVVLRRQTFAAHTVSAVAFPGAAGALLLGVSAVYGYFTLCVATALGIAALRGGGAHEESALTGTVQAFLLASGFLFTALYRGLLEGPQTIFFGTFLGITSSQVTVLMVVGAVVLAVLALIGRPLLFASVDPQVAGGRGVPVRALSVVFLVLLGAATAEASQITGTLLVFAFMVIPAATAQVLTARPASSLAPAVLLALAATWLGLTAAYYAPYPLGFFVTTIAFAGYLLALGWGALRELAGRAGADRTAARGTGPTPAAKEVVA